MDQCCQPRQFVAKREGYQPFATKMNGRQEPMDNTCKGEASGKFTDASPLQKTVVVDKLNLLHLADWLQEQLGTLVLRMAEDLLRRT